jgi:hypothetical protein
MTNWYYYDQTGKKCGPVDSGTLKTLAQHGIITPSTTITNDTGKGAIAGDIKGLEFSQNLIPINMPPIISKPVPIPPVVQVPIPVVTNTISTPLEDSFSRLAGGASTKRNFTEQNHIATDEVTAYFLEKKNEEQKKKESDKKTQSCAAIGCFGFLIIFGILIFFAHEKDKKRWEEEAREQQRIEQLQSEYIKIAHEAGYSISSDWANGASGSDLESFAVSVCAMNRRYRDRVGKEEAGGDGLIHYMQCVRRVEIADAILSYIRNGNK